MTWEIVVLAVSAAVFAVTYWMFWAGLAGSTHTLWLKRCPDCGHMRVATGRYAEHPTECAYCRHPRLAAHLAPNRLRHNFHREW